MTWPWCHFPLFNLPECVYPYMQRFRVQSIAFFFECKCAFDFWRYHRLFWFFFFCIKFIAHLPPCPYLCIASPIINIHLQRVPLFQLVNLHWHDNDYLIWLYLHHLKSIFILWFPLKCFIVYGFGQKFKNNMYPSLRFHTKYFHCSENPLCSICPSLCTPTSSNHWSYTVLAVFLFQNVR